MPPEPHPDALVSGSKSRLELIIDQLKASHSDPSVTWLFGAEHLAGHAAQRRIVWVPMGGELVAPRQAGAALVANHRVVMCRTREERVEAHIYAENRETVDDLFDVLVAVIWNNIPDTKFGTYSHISEEREQAGHTLRTRKILLPVYFRLPVPSEVKPLREATGIEHECGTTDEDGNITQQPD